MDEPQTKAEWIRTALERHGAALVRYATSITGDTESARDVVQDTFVRLCSEPPERVDGHLTEWLFTVCRNRALDVQRKLHRMVPLSDEALTATPGREPNPSTAAENQDTLSLALELLRTLPPRHQEVVRLKFQAGLSYEEIARITQLSTGNVGFILHTALKSLRLGLQRAL